MNAPKQLPNSGSAWVSHFHAHTVKNLSSCSSSACCPSEPRIDVKDPCVSYMMKEESH
jgi:hypothetical protein